MPNPFFASNLVSCRILSPLERLKIWNMAQRIFRSSKGRQNARGDDAWWEKWIRYRILYQHSAPLFSVTPTYHCSRASRVWQLRDHLSWLVKKWIAIWFWRMKTMKSIFFWDDPSPFNTRVPVLVRFWRSASGTWHMALLLLVNTSIINERSKIRTIADHKSSVTVARECIRKREEHTRILSITKVQKPAHESVSENTKSIHAFCQSQNFQDPAP